MPDFSDNEINEIVASLNKVQQLITKNLPDMDITEFNQTDIGRAVSIIISVQEQLTESM